jgi:peptide/nickel transport system permease protein
MQRYFIQRLLQLVVVLFILSIIIFTLVRLIPGDPAAVMLGLEATPEGIEQVRHEMGLDKPIFIQYGIWLRNVLHGDFGHSWVSKQPALKLVLQAFPTTLQLTIASFIVAILIAFPLGIFSALYQRSWLDTFSTFFCLFGISLPRFWFSMMLILLFAVKYQWFPPSGMILIPDDPVQGSRSTVLPAISLGVALAAPLARFLRSGMLDVLVMDYVRTARSKGLHERAVILRHSLKNALLPVITVLGLLMGTLMGGAIVLEQVFSISGIGRLSLSAIQQRDYGIIQAIVLFVAGGFVVINFLVDMLYMYLDPRIRYD